jgi:hypothetical protein
MKKMIWEGFPSNLTIFFFLQILNTKKKEIALLLRFCSIVQT